VSQVLRELGFDSNQPRDERGRWTEAGFASKISKVKTDPKRDAPANFDYASQASQFPVKGKPGLTAQTEEVEPARKVMLASGRSVTEPAKKVDILTHRGEDGKLQAILYHYPQDIHPFEKKGNVNVFVSPDAQRQGLGTKLLKEADKRYDINFEQQEWTSGGRKLIEGMKRKLKTLGGPGSGNFGHAGGVGGRGNPGGSSQGVGRSEQSARALRAFKPAGARVQRHAERNEAKVLQMVGGMGTEGNAPVDVITEIDGKKVGIEVKTMVNNTNDKIWVRTAAREKKEKWARLNKAAVHTVVLDDRDVFKSKGFSGHKVYFAKGAGSFRLGAMTPVKDSTHLKELLAQ